MPRDPASDFSALMSVLDTVFPAFASALFFAPAAVALVRQRETGVRQHINLLGLATAAYWAGWTVANAALAVVVAALFTFVSWVNRFSTDSDPGLIFVLFWFYFVATLPFVAFVSTGIVKDPKPTAVGPAVTFMPIISMGIWALLEAVAPSVVAVRVVFILLVPFCGLFQGFEIMLRLEADASGLQASNFAEAEENSLSMLHVILLFVGSWALWTSVCVIVDGWRLRIAVAQADDSGSKSKSGTVTRGGIKLAGQVQEQFEGADHVDDAECIRVTGLSRVFFNTRKVQLDKHAESAARKLGAIASGSDAAQDPLTEEEEEAVRALSNASEGRVSQFNDLLHSVQLGIHLQPTDFVAAAGVDLVLPRGSISTILGPNGSGKTTTQQVMTGQL